MKTIIVSVVIIVSIVLGLYNLIYNGIHWDTGHGEHTGYVTAIETNGLFIKTDRAYLKTDTQSSQEDVYCVVSPEVRYALQEAVDRKSHVTVKYQSWFIPGAFYCDAEGAVITSVSAVAN